MPFTLLGVTALVFCLTRLVPGGPVERLMQEHGMISTADEGTVGHVTTEERERLIEQFNLDEPIWKAYLQWLGVLRRREGIVKAEFDDAGNASLTTSAADGRPRVLRVRLEGNEPLYEKPQWFRDEGWKLSIESPEQRAKQLGKLDSRSSGVTGSESPPRARAVMYRMVWSGVAEGDLGRSYKYDATVLGMMSERIPVTLYFGILSVLVMYVVSIPLGVWKAVHHNGIGDKISTLLLYVAYAVPGFALGTILLLYLGAHLNYLPLYGLTDANFATLTFTEKLADIARHTILPLTCYTVGALALTTMLMKNCMLENLGADYMRTAAAKGMSYRRAVWRHALRNALIPMASGLGSVICSVVGGSILIERVFGIHGFGMLSYQALVDRDYTLVMGTLLLSAVAIVLGNLASDILVARLDPRIEFH